MFNPTSQLILPPLRDPRLADPLTINAPPALDGLCPLYPQTLIRKPWWVRGPCSLHFYRKINHIRHRLVQYGIVAHLGKWRCRWSLRFIFNSSCRPGTADRARPDVWSPAPPFPPSRLPPPHFLVGRLRVAVLHLRGFIAVSASSTWRVAVESAEYARRTGWYPTRSGPRSRPQLVKGPTLGRCGGASSRWGVLL